MELPEVYSQRETWNFGRGLDVANRYAYVVLAVLLVDAQGKVTASHVRRQPNHQWTAITGVDERGDGCGLCRSNSPAGT
ncbi:hypothetical protein ACX801_20400 [Arthrobacter bambusae]